MRPIFTAAFRFVSRRGGRRSRDACRLVLGAALSAGLLWQPDAGAAEVMPEFGPVVDEARLADVRGGFDLGGGLLVSFGLTRSVLVNGVVVSSTALNIPDLSQLNAAQAASLAATLGTTQLIQNGAGNAIDAGARATGAGATLIQNSLDNQTIKNLTTINAAVTNLGILKSVNTLATLRDAVSNALPSR